MRRIGIRPSGRGLITASPNVAQYIYDSLTMWIGEYRVDGFRWDSVSNIYNTNSGTGTYLPDGWTLLQSANVQTVTANPAFVNIAEDLTGNATVTAALAQAGAGFASQWNGNFVSPMRDPADADRATRR